MKIIYVQTNTVAKGGGIQGAHHTLVSTNMIWWELIVQNRAKASQSSRGGALRIGDWDAPATIQTGQKGPAISGNTYYWK